MTGREPGVMKWTQFVTGDDAPSPIPIRDTQSQPAGLSEDSVEIRAQSIGRYVRTSFGINAAQQERRLQAAESWDRP